MPAPSVKSEVVRVSWGATFEYFLTGLAVCVLSIWLSLSVHPTFAVLLLPGLFLLISLRGIEFIPDKNLRRFYINIVGVRLGIWHTYPGSTELHLTRQGQYKFATWGRWGTSGHVSYFYIMMIQGDEHIEMNVFYDYIEARDWMQAQAARLGMNAVDDFMHEVEESRRNRRRE